MDLNPDDLERLLEFTKGLSRQAGLIILQGSKSVAALNTSEEGVNFKTNTVDLVTQWDTNVEAFVKEQISKQYPKFSFIGEESYVPGTEFTDEPTFCVDPIDGTTNFIHGFPFVCISIGFVYKKRPILGCIYNPLLGLLYYGLEGKGAFVDQNGSTSRLPLCRPRALESLSTALIGVEWGSDRSKDAISKKASSFAKLAGDSQAIAGGKMVHSLRSLGSAALNFAMVASGALDIYWEIGCWPWDVCAGITIAQEAGCLVSGGSQCSHDGEVTMEILTGRKYIVVREIADTNTNTGRARQTEVIKEFYETVEEWDV